MAAQREAGAARWIAGLDNEALVGLSRKVRTERERVRLTDLMEQLAEREGASSWRKAALEMEVERWGKDRAKDGRMRPAVRPRETDLGFDVVAHLGGPVLRSFPGPRSSSPETSRGAYVRWVAEIVVQGRLGGAAVAWLARYEAGGAARERAVREDEDPPGAGPRSGG